MKRTGCVEVASDECVARCICCAKSLVYLKQVNWRMWKLMLKGFIEKHEKCSQIKGD